MYIIAKDKPNKPGDNQEPFPLLKVGSKLPRALLKKQAKGSALLFTMVILLLMGLLGMAIHINTINEQRVTQRTFQGRDAFGKADSTLAMALFLARPLLTPELGNPEVAINEGDRIKPGAKFSVVLPSTSGFQLENFLQLGQTVNEDQIKERYLAASRGSREPDLELLYDNNLVGSAALAYGFRNRNAAGESQGEDNYSGDVGSKYKAVIFLVITADGQQPDASGNYYTGNVETAHSLVNAIFKHITEN